MKLNSINIDYVLNMKNPTIIDIRDNYTYNLGHIKGAINIPYYNLLNNYSHYLNKNDKYYLYCDNGRQSMEISNRLNLFIIGSSFASPLHTLIIPIRE